jgi:hypothetical protein
MRTFSSTAALAIALALPATVIAQDTGKGFLFGTPSGSVTIRTGWAGASANSQLFKFTTDNLTLNRGDFSSPELGIDLAFATPGNSQIVISGDLSGMDKRSWFRNLIDNNDQNIEQVTQFRRLPVTATFKKYLNSTGQSIGKFAWIPTRAAAYVGAGGGIQYYRFKQMGDFVDAETMNVYPDTYNSDGWTGEGHVLAGFDYTLNPRFAITTEGKYSWSKGRLSDDFSGFDRIDLSGFATTIGLTIRY